MSKIAIRPMTAADADAMQTIDKLVFAAPWPDNSFAIEALNDQSFFFVAHTVEGNNGVGNQIVGHIGYWLVLDEAQIATFAVHPDWQRRGIGERLLIALLRDAKQRGAIKASLEVRESNIAAKILYARYGFWEVGSRPNYYRDNFETALLLTLEPLPDLHQSEHLQERNTL